MNAGLTQIAAAERLGKSRQQLGNYERDNGDNMPDEAMLETMAQLYRTTAAELRYGNTVNVGGSVGLKGRLDVRRGGHGDPGGVPHSPNPALAKNLPQRVYDVVLGYLRRLDRIGLTREQFEEAERLLTMPAFGKLHARETRERTEDEMITDIESVWRMLSDIFSRQGVRP